MLFSEDAATSSLVADKLVILSLICVFAERILSTSPDKFCIEFWNRFILSSITVNFSLVVSIISFCLSADSADFCIFTEASSTFTVNFSIISVIFPVDSFVSSESLRISSATTAKPFPASPALAASMDALSASRLV